MSSWSGTDKKTGTPTKISHHNAIFDLSSSGSWACICGLPGYRETLEHKPRVFPMASALQSVMLQLCHWDWPSTGESFEDCVFKKKKCMKVMYVYGIASSQNFNELNLHVHVSQLLQDALLCFAQYYKFISLCIFPCMYKIIDKWKRITWHQ